MHAAKFGPAESNETTHYTVADAEGNIASVTYTLNGGYGSKVTATGLGFLLNNEMDDFAAKPGEANMYGLVQGEANAIQPRKTAALVDDADDRAARRQAATGARVAGRTHHHQHGARSDGQRDRFRDEYQDAVNWPRFHHQWLPDELRMEPGFSPDTVALLEQRGYTVKPAGAQGEVAAIRFANGWLEGAADPRTEGTAEGY